MSLPALEAIKLRRTVRSFKPDPVPSDLFQQVLQAGLHAPTSGNLQPWEFFRVVTPTVREQLVASTFGGYSQSAPSQAWLLEAPEIIAACCDTVRTMARYGEDGQRYARLDVAAAIQNMLIAATSLGLGAAWIGGYREPEVRAALDLDPDLDIVGLVAFGYARESLAAPYRMPLSDVLREI